MQIRWFDLTAKHSTLLLPSRCKPTTPPAHLWLPSMAYAAGQGDDGQTAFRAAEKRYQLHIDQIVKYK